MTEERREETTVSAVLAGEPERSGAGSEGDSARLISVSEAERRTEEERRRWQEEAEARARADADRIRELEEELLRTREEAASRETRLRCCRLLSERGLSESLSGLLLAEGAMPDEAELVRRADLLREAVEAEALRCLRERTGGFSPRIGREAPLTGAMIREMPLSRLAEIMGK